MTTSVTTAPPFRNTKKLHPALHAGPRQKLLDRLHDPLRIRNRCLLEILGVGQRNLHTGDATDRRIQVIESLLLNSACDLCTDPVRTPGLLDGERSMRLPDRGEHRLHVKGAETPEVHHLSLDSL